MRMLIGKCNNSACIQNDGGKCGLSANIVHEFQYDHDTGLLSCQWFIDSEQKDFLDLQKRISQVAAHLRDLQEEHRKATGVFYKPFV